MALLGGEDDHAILVFPNDKGNGPPVLVSHGVSDITLVREKFRRVGTTHAGDGFGGGQVQIIAGPEHWETAMSHGKGIRIDAQACRDFATGCERATFLDARDFRIF